MVTERIGLLPIAMSGQLVGSPVDLPHGAATCPRWQTPSRCCAAPRSLCACTKKAGVDRSAVVALHWRKMEEAERDFAAFTRVAEAAAILRAHPDDRAPETRRSAILAVLRQEGLMQGGQLQ